MLKNHYEDVTAAQLTEASRQFTEIYKANAGRVLNFCFRMTGDEQLSRDLAQDIWVKVYQNLDTFQGKSAVFTWIYRIALNHLLNHFKKEKRRRWREILNLDVVEGIKKGETEPYQPPDMNGVNPLDRLQQQDREKIVWRMIRRLPEKQRAPLVLLRYQEMSYRQIAQVLGVSVNAVESRLHRAKIKLQKLLEPYLSKI